MTELQFMIVEEQNIESRIHAYLAQGKTARYIRTKLLQKKFEKTLIDTHLEDQSDILKNPETYRAQIEKSIQKGEQK